MTITVVYNGWTKSPSDTESLEIARSHADTLRRLYGDTRAKEIMYEYLEDGMTAFETAQALGRAVNFYCPEMHPMTAPTNQVEMERWQ